MSTPGDGARCLPRGHCIVTYVTRDGRRCWFVAGTGGAPDLISGRVERIGYLLTNRAQAEVAALGAQLAWAVYGPPYDQTVAGPRSDACEAVRDAPYPPPDSLTFE